MKLSPRRLGIFQVVLSGLCFGLLGFLGKLAYRHGLRPGELLSFRFLIGSGFLGLFLLGRDAKVLLLSRRALFWCAILGILGYAVFSSCFFFALQGLSASLTVLLLYTYPVIVAAGAWICFGEKIPRERMVVLPMVLVGLFLLIGGDFHVEKAMALLFGIGASLFYSLYILLSSRVLKGVNVLAATFYIQLFAGTSLALFHLRDLPRDAELFRDLWPLLMMLGFICSALAMTLFLAGLEKLRSWEVSILSTVEPVTGIMIAVIFLRESLSGGQIIGALSVFAAILFVQMPVKKKAT